MYKSGFIAVVGRPNSGKSSFINSLIGEDLCPVAPLPQTTRQTIRGILTTEKGQIVFVDTPGMHQGSHLINNVMADSVKKAVNRKEADVVIYIVDLSRTFGEEESVIANIVRNVYGKVLILFNKTDIAEDPKKQANLFFETFPKLINFEHDFICASELKNREIITDKIIDMLPNGEAIFPEDYITDAPMRFLASEIIRRQVILNTKEEVPHAVCIAIDNWEEDDNTINIEASIIAETSGQRGIIIGTGAKKIKQIKQFSRKEIARIGDKKVKLELFVKIRKKWRDNPVFLKSIGMDLTKKKKQTKAKSNR